MPDQAPPQTLDLQAVSPIGKDEMQIVRLARELAMGFRDVGDILERHDVSREEFERLRSHPFFVSVLTSELTSWEAAGNAPERIKLKSAHLIEEWLPELYAAMCDTKEALSSRVKAGELAAKLAGLGVYDARLEGAAADRVQITINMGATKLQVERGIIPKVIDNMPLSESTLSDSTLSGSTLSDSTLPFSTRSGGVSNIFHGTRDDALQSNIESEPVESESEHLRRKYDIGRGEERFSSRAKGAV
jgi:hypothetical protein